MSATAAAAETSEHQQQPSAQPQLSRTDDEALEEATEYAQPEQLPWRQRLLRRAKYAAAVVADSEWRDRVD